MSTVPEKRTGLLERMLGKGQTATKARTAIATLQEALDESGVARKEIDMTLLPKAKALIEDVNARVDEMLSTIVESPSEGLRGKILQAIIAEVAGGAMEEAVAEEPLLEEMAADDVEELAVDEETKELMREVISQNKMLARDNNQLTDDLAEMVKAMTQIANEHKELRKKAVKYEDGINRIASLEKELIARPRYASRALETAVDLPDEVISEIKSSTDGKKTFFSVPLKD